MSLQINIRIIHKGLILCFLLSYLTVIYTQDTNRRPVPKIDNTIEHDRSTKGDFDTETLLKLKDKMFQDLKKRAVKPKQSGYSLISIEQTTTTSTPTLKGPELLLDGSYQDALTSFPSYGIAKVQPWSGYYWAYRYGLLSARYSSDDKNSMCLISNGQIVQWLTYGQSIYSYSQPKENLAVKQQSTQAGYQNYVNNYYSPAEKIDLLFGDNDFSMTNYMKSQGNQYIVDNDVPSWLGVCNGWAPASYLEPRVKKSVTMTAYDNKTQITFLPDDMEAYASLYYAMSPYNIKLIGSRCSDVNDKTCTLMNAGVFTIVMANMLGLRKQNLIFEPKVDSEIWNFPAYAYTFQFYNLKTRQSARNYVNQLTMDALMRKTDMKSINDPIFIKAVNSPSFAYTNFYAGIRLCIYHVGEDYPYHDVTSFDDTTGQTCYDMILALGNGYKIVDGFWDQTEIPTYMWTPINPDTIKGIYDDYVPSFTGTVADIAKYRLYAINSSKKGTVLKNLMKYFMQKGSQ